MDIEMSDSLPLLRPQETAADNWPEETYNHPDWWYPPADLDAFLVSLYTYHRHGGVAALLALRAHRALVHTFVWSVGALCVFGIDWGSLVGHDGHADLAEFSTECSGACAACAAAYGMCGVGYLVWQARHVALELPRWRESGRFCAEVLGVRDPTEVTWPELVRSMGGAQSSGIRILACKQELEPVDVALRVLRRENYLVALAEDGVLGCEMDHVVALCAWATLSPLFGKTGYQFAADRRAYRRACWTLACGGAFLMPVVLVVYAAYLVLRSAELSASPGGKVALRAWTPSSRWALREYNEYSYQVHDRLLRAASRADAYLGLYPQPVLRRFLSLGKFVAGSATGCFSLLALLHDDAMTDLHIWNHSLLWWLGVSTGVFALLRALLPDEQQHSPEALDRALDELREEIRYPPFAWTRPHSTAHGSVRTWYPYFVWSWVKSAGTVISMPCRLCSWAARADEICTYLEQITLATESAGDVCVHSAAKEPTSPGSRVSRSRASFIDHHAH